MGNFFGSLSAASISSDHLNRLKFKLNALAFPFRKEELQELLKARNVDDSLSETFWNSKFTFITSFL
jgi:hypothetical protein